LKDKKKNVDNFKRNNERQDQPEVKIKYDIHTPEDREPPPKAYDEIEY
jgi:hypothetical protein